jgi:hypothetical protein
MAMYIALMPMALKTVSQLAGYIAVGIAKSDACMSAVLFILNLGAGAMRDVFIIVMIGD